MPFCSFRSPAALLLSLLPALAAAQPVFEPAFDVSPNSVVPSSDAELEDIDGDGDPDLILPCAQCGGIAWFRNEYGDFGDQISIPLEDGAPDQLYPADYDRDGDLDLVVTFEGQAVAGWLENRQSSARFIYHRLIEGEYAIQAMHVRDLNSDGRLDLLVTESVNLVVWYQRMPDGSLGERAILDRRSSTLSADARDVDGDERLDLVIVGRLEVRWRRQESPGVFADAEPLVSAVPVEVGQVQLADVDGDTDPDLVYLDKVTGQIGWYENQGGVPFAPLEPITSASHPNQALALRDLDDDGLLDVMTYKDQSLVWARNQGGGRFESDHVLLSRYSRYADPASLRTGDIDGDGRVDLLVPDGQVVWHSGSKPMPFQNGRVITPTFYTRVPPVLTDINGDGRLDIAVATEGLNQLLWFLNEGGGAFSTPVHLDVERCSAWAWEKSLRAGDIDDDGDTDFVLLCTRGGIALRQAADGFFVAESFEPVVPLPREELYSNHYGRGLVDLDADGDLDLITVSEFGNPLGWYENDGTGAFQARQTLLTDEQRIEYITLTDLDLDGQPDIVIPDRTTELLRLYRNDLPTGIGSAEDLEISASSVQAVDLDLDGDDDLITRGTGAEEQSIRWHENDGSGRFLERGEVARSGVWEGLPFFGDFDLDGDLDFLNGHGLWLNDGKLSFSSTERPCESGRIGGYEDLDGDGAPDLVMGSDTRLWVCLNRTPPTTEEQDPEPTGLTLSVIPNPSTGSTRLSVDHPPGASPDLRIFDALGREVARLDVPSGEREIAWEAPSPGVYLVRLGTEAGRVTRTLSVVR
ncbi:MAG: T9SS type A sorting domain-containing protein [Bacteroidota bacterium]